MKGHVWVAKLVVCSVFGSLLCACAPRPPPVGSGEKPLPPSVNVTYPQGRILSDQQLGAIVTTTLEKCSTQAGKAGRIDPASVIPSRNTRDFSESRIAKTLHGMWRGHVIGDDKDVKVDYFWIFDTKRGEGLIIAQRTGKETMAALKPLANAPKLSYLMCAHEGYYPSKETPQIQEFVKVSDDIADAPRILNQATGLKVQAGAREPSLAEMWRGLQDMKYFHGLPAVAFAGGFFKPLQIKRVASEVGPAQVLVRWDSEYYGGGSTAIKFTSGTPIKGVEYAQFVGVSTSKGDFLVASPGNGKIWKVEAMAGGSYDLGFDSVVLGPMEP